MFRKALLRPPWHFQKCSSTLYHFHIAFMGCHPACPGPEPGEPRHFLRACRNPRVGGGGGGGSEVSCSFTTGFKKPLRSVRAVLSAFWLLRAPLTAIACSQPTMLLCCGWVWGSAQELQDHIGGLAGSKLMWLPVMQIIMSHLIGTGDQPGLRYRLLPIEHFNNMRALPC